MEGFHRGTVCGLCGGHAGKVSTFHCRANVKENAKTVKAWKAEEMKERAVEGKKEPQADGIADYRGDC